jgi:hypothetical protein
MVLILRRPKAVSKDEALISGQNLVLRDALRVPQDEVLLSG